MGLGWGFVWHVFDETDTDAWNLLSLYSIFLVPFISYLVLLVLFFSPLLSTHSYLPTSFGPWFLGPVWHILADAGVLVFGLRLLLLLLLLVLSAFLGP
jgi:hypothetical protein